MAVDLKQLIDALKLERDILKSGGYGRSVRTPWKATNLFRDSVTCLNFGETAKIHPCNECLLWEHVPEDHRDEDIPCHSIPLNTRGDTIASLEARGDRDTAEHALLDWLDRTIWELEQRAAKQEANSIH